MANRPCAVFRKRSRPVGVAKFILAPCVEGELDEIWEFIARDNPEAATRVVLAAYDTFLAVAVNPGLGHPCAFGRKALGNVRARNVQGFENYLILYRKIPKA